MNTQQVQPMMLSNGQPAYFMVPPPYIQMQDQHQVPQQVQNVNQSVPETEVKIPQQVEQKKTRFPLLKVLFFAGFILPLIWPIIVFKYIKSQSHDEEIWAYRSLSAFLGYLAFAFFITIFCVLS
ncbi:hypothetical protein EIN_354600 [Entamoeba invadens IP1]|uniref:Uncharacterized protein n=1 Tax=Entamoeba invadens IP1 TaxID=370355 RepID=L7FMZ9_ENTIV|nr:hypothetical protein EIN_354600 [Entamoeba invadens IP1]ELP87158.1 hypothetical protein EIN_354600 [Entamoeba invadens IP1]|eukprot:XP_004253929.1 hypothetical protein EIN_354600 [Entamoeba invadens IP1]